MDTSALLAAAPYTRYYCEENVYKLLELATSEAPTATSRRLFAVFISNPDRKVLLFHQAASRAGPDMDHYVVWDYHVVAVAIEEGAGLRRAVVLDRDTLLGASVPLETYIQATFRPDLFAAGYLDPSLQSMFRIVPAADLLLNFASDRSHMLVKAIDTRNDENRTESLPGTEMTSTVDRCSLSVAQDRPPEYLQPHPPYPPICGAGARHQGHSHNLFTHWLKMEDDESVAKAGPGGPFGTVVRSVDALLAYFA
ncbi:hypothetical protein JCM10908_004254 [Rhodotorula pacifica]|uniref:uncharacterized protein n=1 Tax=Rhodotorula pacifica TaxID=1495444 RepID=UPI00317739B4